ncbi:unnamed protein product [Closterium sp. NIES-64]|nr:unnamed protein product [Closterium sp. NIES-64]
MSSTLAPPPPPQCSARLAPRRRSRRAASRSRLAAPSQPRASSVTSSAAPSAARSATAHPHGSRRSAFGPAPASTARLPSARRALTSPAAVLDVPSQRASPAACRAAVAGAADGADVSGRLSAEERDTVGSADVAIITNGPGEVAAWVTPVVASLAHLPLLPIPPRSLLPAPCHPPQLARLSLPRRPFASPSASPQVLLAPCPHASGNELAVLRAMPHVHRCTVRAQGGGEGGGCGCRAGRRCRQGGGLGWRCGTGGGVDWLEGMGGRTCDGPQDFFHMLLFTRPAAAAGGQHTGGGKGEGEAPGGRTDGQQRHQGEGEADGELDGRDGEGEGEWGWRGRGVVVFLGGEQLNAVVLAWRLGYRCLVYAEDAARWPWLVDMSALRSPVLLPAIPPTLLAARRARVVGDLFLSAVAQAQGVHGGQGARGAQGGREDEGRRGEEGRGSRGEGEGEEREVVVGLLPGSKDVKLMVGVPFFLSVAHVLNKTCSHSGPRMRFMLPLAPTVQTVSLARFASRRHNALIARHAWLPARLLPPSATAAPPSPPGGGAGVGWEYLGKLVAGEEEGEGGDGEGSEEEETREGGEGAQEGGGVEVEVWRAFPSYALLSQCSLALTTVGTNTAELAALGVPMVVVLPTLSLELFQGGTGGVLGLLPALLPAGPAAALTRFLNASLLRSLPFLAWPNRYPLTSPPGPTGTPSPPRLAQPVPPHLPAWPNRYPLTSPPGPTGTPSPPRLAQPVPPHLPAWPNRWAGREVVPEVVGEVGPGEVAAVAARLLGDAAALEAMGSTLRQVASEYGGGKGSAAGEGEGEGGGSDGGERGEGAADAIADEVLKLLLM